MNLAAFLSFCRQGRTSFMQPHQPRDLNGPLRGTSSWWRGLDPQPNAAEHDEKREPPRKGKYSREHGPPIRQDLVARIKKEIADGTYDTPEKWDAALDRLLERMDSD
jgi:hypothetical protein